MKKTDILIRSSVFFLSKHCNSACGEIPSLAARIGSSYRIWDMSLPGFHMDYYIYSFIIHSRYDDAPAPVPFCGTTRGREGEPART